MKKILFLQLVLSLFGTNYLLAQVTTNFNNENIISGRGQFLKNYRQAIDLIIPPKSIDSLLLIERLELAQSNEVKPFRLASPITVNIDIVKLTNWIFDKDIAYGKFTIRLSGAMSSSINFDKFYLPENTELFIYNEDGKMMTGPVTEKENNPNKIWGSWVYQGDLITIEIRTPIATMSDLILHANNIAYGYKEIYKSIKVGGFGQSGSCNINVICPLGNGWEAERNSVSTILSANGGEFCTGSLVMNTCGTNTPYYLTANHCFEGNSNTGGWRFAFQAWSTTCPNPGVNTNGVMYNGSTFRARNAASDFCLVELNTKPPANSGLHYAGWTRTTTPAQNATAIHHPRGDLMKITRANNPVTVGSYGGTTNQHWRADWSSQNNGSGQTVTPVTEPGSSGSPLFDQNHRIIGQLNGGPSVCGGSQLWDFYGRFDLSWTGGGTNATRLSNWLDPSNSGAVTTNTTNVASLVNVDPASYSIAGPNQFCTSATYSITNLPAGATVRWSVTSNYGQQSQSTSNNVLTLNRVSDGSATIAATITFCGGNTIQVPSLTVQVGGTVITVSSTQSDCEWVQFNVSGAAAGASYNWSSGGNTILFNGTSTTATTSVGQINAVISGYDVPIVTTTNTCGQTVSASGYYNPYERNFQGLYSEYASCGDHLSVSVNTTPFDTYYRWYVNDVLVSEGAYASYYCTCYYNGPDARQPGDNTIRVEVETICNITSAVNDQFLLVCGSYYKTTDVELFPNPAKDQVNIRLKQLNSKTGARSLTEIREIIILDKLGNVKGRFKYPSLTKAVNLSVSNLSSDLYFLEISDGKKKSRVQLSVQK